MNKSYISLSELLESIRNEIEILNKESHSKPIVFVPQLIEVEVKAVVDRGTEAQGGINIWVIDLKGSSKEFSANSQTIKLSMSIKMNDDFSDVPLGS